MSVAAQRKPTATSEMWVARLGLIDYDAAQELQVRLRDARVEGRVADTLLLLEHPPVYTLGRRSLPDEMPLGEDWYRARGIILRDADRGGKTTYHGPGQLVGYPIVDTTALGRDVTGFVRAIEGAIIGALAQVGVRARRDRAGRGVWAGDGKIGSIGLRVARGVTTHGFMVNVNCDLSPFTWIKPCGLDDPATSIAAQTGEKGDMSRFQRGVAHELAVALGLRQRAMSKERLLAVLDGTPSPPDGNAPSRAAAPRRRDDLALMP